MYLSFYGLSEKPFGQTPDPKFLYWNDAYRETIASLRYGIGERKGFITMIGEAGTGKTTLLRKLLDDLGPDVVSVFLFNPNATFEEILEYTLGELGIPAPAGRKLAMLQRLNEFLLAAFQEGKNTILLIDEAQDLETEVLESLRLLSNLETSKEKILQIVLSGQPELATRLAQPNLRQLKQRIAVRCRLEPLARQELPEYIAARLAVAGGRPDLFAPATLEPIWSFAQGIPRLVNAVCDNALLVGYALGHHTIDEAVIREVVADLNKIDAPLELAADPRVPPAGQSPAGPGPSPSRPVATGSAASAALVAAGPTAGPSNATAPAPPVVIPPPGEAPAHDRRETSRTGASVSPAATDPSRTTPGRAAGFVVAAGLILVLAAVAAFAASRWHEIRPRVRALLAEPADERTTLTHPGSPPAPPGPLAPAPSIEPVAAERERTNSQPVPAAEVQVATTGMTDTVPPQPPPGSLPEGPRSTDVGGAAGAASSLSAPIRAAPPAPGPAARDAVSGGGSGMGTAVLPAAADSPEPVGLAAAAPPARGPSQHLQAPRRAVRGGRRVQVQLGDTLMNLAAREYGSSTYTALDVVRSTNPGIQDVDRIIAGSEIVFPDPGPGARVSGRGEDLTVLVGTTPALAQAQDLQRMASARFGLPADLEPIAVGEGRNLYRVSLRNVADQALAREIAESLGSILKDPG